LVTGIKVGRWFIDPVMVIGAISLSVLIGVLSSIYPAIRASKMDPTTALRSL
jgi:putative ABC transport system permease protein